MATHSSVLAWRIPWKEQPGGLGTVPGVAKSRTWLSGRSVHVLCPEDWPFRACITPADLSLQQPSEQGACGKLLDASPMPTLQGSSYLAHRKLKLGMVSHIPLYVCVCVLTWENVQKCLIYEIYLISSESLSSWLFPSTAEQGIGNAADRQTDRQTEGLPGRGQWARQKSLVTSTACIWFLPLSPIGVPVANERILKGVQGCN